MTPYLIVFSAFQSEAFPYTGGIIGVVRKCGTSHQWVYICAQNKSTVPGSRQLKDNTASTMVVGIP